MSYHGLLRSFLCLISLLSIDVTSAMSMSTYDIIVIGGGSAGLTAAKLTSGTFGKSVVIVEQERLGGDCTWTGCVPSKSLLAAAKSVHAARKFGLLSPNEKPDFQKIRKTITDNMQNIYDADDPPNALAKFGVDVMSGSATLVSPSTLEVRTKDSPDSITLTAKEGIILCTGAEPRPPTSIEGLDKINYLTYETIWSVEEIPDKLTVLGGGPIGCELAQAFSRLGSQVTIVAPGLLPREDPAVQDVMEKVFANEGITIVKGKAVAAKGEGASSHSISVKQKDGSVQTLDGNELLVALGRAPRVKGMGLEEVGITIRGTGGIEVNDKLQTSVKGVYASGDCTGDRQFTHYAGFQGAIAARNIILPLTDPGVLESVPAVTFTSPEVASVGLTEAQAIEKYGKDKIAVAEQQLSEVDRAVCEGETDGFLKVVYSKKNGRILGACIVAPSAGEMISEITLAMEAKFPFSKLATVMHAYPAYSIALQLMAADVYYVETMKLKPVYKVLKFLGL